AFIGCLLELVDRDANFTQLFSKYCLLLTLDLISRQRHGHARQYSYDHHGDDQLDQRETPCVESHGIVTRTSATLPVCATCCAFRTRKSVTRRMASPL